MVFMLAIVAFCVVCLIHREKSAFVVQDQLRHGTPSAFWWDRVLLSDNITGLRFFATQSCILRTVHTLTGRLVFSFYEEVGEDKAQTNTRPWNKAEEKGKFNWFATYSVRQEVRKQVKRKSQIYSVSDQPRLCQVYPPQQQILHISGVRLHYGFEVLFKMTFNTTVATQPGFL